MLQLCEGSEYFLNLVQLVHLGLSREERFAVSEFAHDAPYGPDVDLHGVLVAEQEFGTAVPSSGHVVGHLGILSGLGDVPGEPEVAEFEVVFGVYEKVLWLDVSVDHVHLVAIVNGFE